MTRERFCQIRGVYEAALNIEPAQRDSFLKGECQGDRDLRNEVERLLIAREQAVNWLKVPLAGPADQFSYPDENRPARLEGRRLGAYQIVREIGRGGMGSVYLAERADGVVHKQVAIKLVRSGLYGLYDTDLLERFHKEREILASLDHPAISRLIDGGSTEEGVPYLIMDYVQGQPIDRWCDEHKLNVTQRLTLFRSVCDAVQYAHQNLVVHRDLKPANILVTADGRIKLLDFGIAKLLAPQPATGSPEPTITLALAMTPEYASPEQIKGETINTLTDVYSLAVVLYELLTGRRPYRLTGGAHHEMARLICEQEPVRPSRVVTTTEDELEDSPDVQHAVTPETVSAVREGSPLRLRHRLEGDLDSILLMALRKEPARRYSSVEQFSQDLGRHLEQLPVVARKDSIGYRLDKLLRRHPGGIAATVLIVLSIFAGLITTGWESRIAFEERREAEALVEKARRIRAQSELRSDPDQQKEVPASDQNSLQGRTISRPQMVLLQYAAIVTLGAVIYFRRATIIRAMGALTGGAAFALAGLAGYRLAQSLGGGGGFLFLRFCLGAMQCLVLWRVGRRWGWRAQAALTIGVAILGPLRDRVHASLMDVIVDTPLLAEMAIWAVGLAVAQGVMRVVAGPAQTDRLARTR